MKRENNGAGAATWLKLLLNLGCRKREKNGTRAAVRTDTRPINREICRNGMAT